MKRKYVKLLCIVLILTFPQLSFVKPAKAEESHVYTIESAVRIGLDNSVDLKQLKNKIDLSEMKQDSLEMSTDRLADGEGELKDGEGELYSALEYIYESQDSLNQARIDILNGVYPQGFPDVIIVPGALTISSGDDIAAKLTAFNSAAHAGLDVQAITQSITKNVNSAICQNQKLLDEGKVEYEKNFSYMIDNKIDFEIAKARIASSLSEKLDISELSSLSASSERALLMDMADASTRIAVASEGIYRNQIALMIKNNYYNALKLKKIMEVKESTMNRAKTQYQYASDGYTVGLIPMDDMLTADIFYTGAAMDYQKAQDDYNNVLIELKKSMNIPLDQPIGLVDVSRDKKVAMDLEEGLENGLDNRLEIIKGMEQLKIYRSDLDLVEDDYGKDSDRYDEAKKLYQNAALEYGKVQKDVESGIRQSYNTMKSMESLLDISKDMVNQAEQCLDIAESRYNMGFGVDSMLLQSAGLGSLAGTEVEVLSAQENLAKVMEKYTEVLYGYNLAKAKYLNDIAYLTY